MRTSLDRFIGLYILLILAVLLLIVAYTYAQEHPSKMENIMFRVSGRFGNTNEFILLPMQQIKIGAFYQNGKEPKIHDALRCTVQANKIEGIPDEVPAKSVLELTCDHGEKFLIGTVYFTPSN